jgi:membrane protease YdiL (CAAX protease family)
MASLGLLAYISLLLVFGLVNFTGFVSALLAALYFFTIGSQGIDKNRWLWILTICVSIALTINLLPGMGSFSLSPFSDSTNIGTQFHFNVGKSLLAILLVSFIAETFSLKYSKWLWPALLAPCVLIVIALLFGVPFSPKPIEAILTFSLANLFITCIAEEIFFRKLIQDGIERLVPQTINPGVISVVVTSLLFCLAHLFSGLTNASSIFIFLFIASSVTYSLVYYYSRRIELSIACHFMLNLAHFSLLPHPIF